MLPYLELMYQEHTYALSTLVVESYPKRGVEQHMLVLEGMQHSN
jgi:hypothetical protein